MGWMDDSSWYPAVRSEVGGCSGGCWLMVLWVGVGTTTSASCHQSNSSSMSQLLYNNRICCIFPQFIYGYTSYSLLIHSISKCLFGIGCQLRPWLSQLFNTDYHVIKFQQSVNVGYSKYQKINHISFLIYSMESFMAVWHDYITVSKLRKACENYLYTVNLASTPAYVILYSSRRESSNNGSYFPTIMLVFGHLAGHLLSFSSVICVFYFCFPDFMKLYVSKMGLANGLFSINESSPKYSFKHNNSKGGSRMGSSKEFILEGENLSLRSTAGQAKNIPFGRIGQFFISNEAQRDTAKFPPAESPAKMTFVGLILKYLWIFSIINSYAVTQSSKATGNLQVGGFRQSIEKIGIFNQFAHLRVQDCIVSLDKATNPPPCRWIMMVYRSYYSATSIHGKHIQGSNFVQPSLNFNLLQYSTDARIHSQFQDYENISGLYSYLLIFYVILLVAGMQMNRLVRMEANTIFLHYFMAPISGIFHT